VGEESSKAVKAALLISAADRRHYEALKDALANNYLLGRDQYPNTLEKGRRILGNYQTTKVATAFRASPSDMGVAFLQRGVAEESVEVTRPKADLTPEGTATR
jgi:hypothetical protein